MDFCRKQLLQYCVQFVCPEISKVLTLSAQQSIVDFGEHSHINSISSSQLVAENHEAALKRSDDSQTFIYKLEQEIPKNNPEDNKCKFIIEDYQELQDKYSGLYQGIGRTTSAVSLFSPREQGLKKNSSFELCPQIGIAPITEVLSSFKIVASEKTTTPCTPILLKGDEQMSSPIILSKSASSLTTKGSIENVSVKKKITRKTIEKKSNLQKQHKSNCE